ncbi:MBL fold metallo-hydrolase [Alteribacillus iranensis]|uniref:Glyoxylase, beta-lactamase superfamily II n=1 Tax=Alteribacillus iranensis TaxID=930128 RepID=A0A1I2CR53_9BACI|nr:MBL fold metallo-hydrolase [Alteribacillus iranensis]SFE70253.1 Glyoxylase, beta-lactamase superfamily II [Alteribacillus iranensis]
MRGSDAPMALSSSNGSLYPVIVPTKSSLKSFNFYLYQTGDSLVLIDAGINSSSSWNALEEVLQENNFHIKDLTAILLTHHHVDHVGLINRITEDHPIPVFIHPEGIPRLRRNPDFMERRISFFETLYKEAGCGERGKEQISYLREAKEKNAGQAIEADLQPIREKEEIFGLQVIETPGHAPDQVAFYDHVSDRLFAGDLLISHISSNALIEPDTSGNRPQSLLEHMASYNKTLTLDSPLVLPGHGEFIKDHHSLVRKREKEIAEKANQLRLLIQNGTRTADALARTFYAKRYNEQFPLVMSEIIGHLDYLETNGHIYTFKKDGILLYDLT